MHAKQAELTAPPPETARTMAGDSNLQDLLGKLLARSHVGTKVNALRCLGNLAFDNGTFGCLAL